MVCSVGDEIVGRHKGIVLNDLTGKIFGRLKVIELDKILNSRARWWCLCDPKFGGCGNKKSILGGNLISGDIISCGCYKTEINKRKRSENLIGRRFGTLTVIDDADDYIYPNSNAHARRFLCKCDCGEEKSINASALLNGNTESCGGFRHKMDDISGKKFGMLEVIKLDHIDKKSGTYWLCICDCGNTTIVYGTHLRSKTIYSCGCLRESLIANELKRWAKEEFKFVKTEHKVIKNSETNCWLKCDIYIGEPNTRNGIYIEIHGEQHYCFIKHWHKTQDGFKKQKRRDKLKKEFARKNGTYIEVDLRKIKSIEQAIKYIKNIINKI